MSPIAETSRSKVFIPDNVTTLYTQEGKRIIAQTLYVSKKALQALAPITQLEGVSKIIADNSGKVNGSEEATFDPSVPIMLDSNE